MNNDLLDRAVVAVRANPAITNEQLADTLGLRRPMSAHFYRLKALEIVNVGTSGTPAPHADEEKKPLNIFPFRKKSHTGPLDTDASGRRLTTSNMTQDQLRERRINRIEAAKVARPFHESVMLFFLKAWLLIGPPAFVALTTSEVAYIFAALLPAGDSGDKIILLGALFVDLAMMFTTFGVAIKRRDLAEKREVNGSVPMREQAEVWFGTGLWLVFAAINIIGQSAFLLRIVQSSAHPGNLNLIYLFIAARVTGFILGDACTAFFLAKVDSSPLKLIARSEREKGAIYVDVADAEGKRQIAEAEAEAKILLILLDAQQKKEDAEFLAALKRRAFAAALGDTPTSEGPTRSRVYRGNT